MHGTMTPVWALRGEEENSTVEAKLEHHHPELGLVVTDLSGEQVVTYHPPTMRPGVSNLPFIGKELLVILNFIFLRPQRQKLRTTS